jgi:hypothetical protein
MASNFALTIYNILPEWLSDGHHTPFYSEHIDPFRYPFTFGPKQCTSKAGCHVGLHATDDVIGTFAGSEGEFLVLASSRFILMSPKQTSSLTLGTTLFPDPTTHDIVLCEKVKSYPIFPGSIILCMDHDMASSLRSATFFFGIVDGCVISHVRPMLLGSLIRIQKIWGEIHDASTKTVDVGKFSLSKLDLGEKNRLPMPMRYAGFTMQPQTPPSMFEALVSVVQSIHTDMDGQPQPASHMSAKDALQSGLTGRPQKRKV